MNFVSESSTKHRKIPCRPSDWASYFENNPCRPSDWVSNFENDPCRPSDWSSNFENDPCRPSDWAPNFENNPCRPSDWAPNFLFRHLRKLRKHQISCFAICGSSASTKFLVLLFAEAPQAPKFLFSPLRNGDTCWNGRGGACVPARPHIN